MLTELPATRTKLSVTEATKWLAQGYKAVVGKLPSKSILALLVGQWGIETGQGGSMYNYNFGNSMPEPWDKYYQNLHASEVIDGVNTPMVEKFAAYKTPLEGAISHIKVLKSRAHWWNGLQSGNLDKFIDGLKTKPVYFTGNAATYKAGSLKIATAANDIIKKYSSNIFVSILEVAFGLGLGYTAIQLYKRHHHGA